MITWGMANLKEEYPEELVKEYLNKSITSVDLI
jgi:hypothetical protein